MEWKPYVDLNSLVSHINRSGSLLILVEGCRDDTSPHFLYKNIIKYLDISEKNIIFVIDNIKNNYYFYCYQWHFAVQTLQNE
jgi:hypothetical protein